MSNSIESGIDIDFFGGIDIGIDIDFCKIQTIDIGIEIDYSSFRKLALALTLKFICSSNANGKWAHQNRLFLSIFKGKTDSISCKMTYI